jgi:hypothetical protein
MHRPYTQPGAQSGALDADQMAVERYRYLLRTAPPDELEQAHAEAFASLTPDQRRMVLDTLRREVEPAESRGVTDDPNDLARLATRTELRRPGTIERAFGGGGTGGAGMGGAGTGGGIAFGGFLPTLAGAFLGTAIANSLFGGLGGFGPGDAAGFEGNSGSDAGGDAGLGADGTDDQGGRSYGGEWGDGGDGGDLGGDAGDAGGFGDLGGFGDFGGGDFGGGDFGGF